jgi:hypothetical protein
VGADELNGTGPAISRPLNANDVGAGNSSPMPVTLIDFNAKASGNIVVLSWTSSREENFKHYEVEVSTNGTNFKNIGKVYSKNATAANTAYSFNHLTPSTGFNFYRLKMVDRDGSHSYSNIRVVSFSSDVPFTVYPNPASSVATINLGTSVKVAEIIIADASGRIQKRISTIASDRTSERIVVNHFANGTYVVQVIDKDNKVHTQLLTIKR